MSKEFEEKIVAKRKSKRIFRYKCSLTEREYKVTAEAKNPEELMSVEAYYELHPDEDDRPEPIMAQLKIEKENEEQEQQSDPLFDELAQFDVSNKS